jgi:uncharacterized protein YjbJ (UPF0337 family)
MAEHSGRMTDDLLTRLKAAVAGPDGEIDVESVRTNLREAAAKAGADLDADALVARVKDVAGKAEGKLDGEKLRQWLDEADSGKLGQWLAEAKSASAGAAAVVEAHGERLAEQAPGAFDKLVGAAKEKLGEATGSEELTHQGELDQLRGQIKEKYAGQGE